MNFMAMVTMTMMMVTTCDPVPSELGFVFESQACSAVSILPNTLHLDYNYDHSDLETNNDSMLILMIMIDFNYYN